jgi:hypothetical protein
MPGDVSSVNNKLLWWLMGIVGTLLVALGGAWANSMYGAVGKVEVALTKQADATADQGKALTVSLDNLARELRTIQTQHLERIVRLESASATQAILNEQTRAQLTRIETTVGEVRDRVNAR